jgi:glycosyltransferase involved in cell wall biosynthesis
MGLANGQFRFLPPEDSMRVTIVTETYHPQVNGVSRTLGHLVRHLSEAGDSVQLIHPRYRRGPAAEAEEVHLVRAWRPRFYEELHLALPPFGGVHRALDAFGPDVVHIATEALLGLSVLRHALRREIPVVSSFHTNFDQYSEHYRLGWTRGLIWRYLRWFHNRTRETYAPSPTTIGGLEARGFERLVLWPRGVDGRLYRPGRPGRARVREVLGFEPGDVVIGHVGRIAPEKNMGYLAEALERVAASRQSARFLFVGDGPARPELERRMGAPARFVGYRSGDDLADHYASADLFVFTSLTETFGNVVLEAMASGLPVVALRAGGVADTVLDGSTGLLVDPSAPPDRFAEALTSLVDDRATRDCLSREARACALGREWDDILSALRERYLRVIGEAVPDELAANVAC